MRGEPARGVRWLVVLAISSGCLVGGAAQTPPHQTPPASPNGSECASWVAFYGLGSPAQRTWAPDRISIGYTVPPGASVFFVAFEDETILGATHVSTEDLDHGITADGDGIPLEEPLNGSHRIHVTTYMDANENDRFDPALDRPCRSDGELVRTDSQRINFTQFYSTPPSPTASPAD